MRVLISLRGSVAPKKPESRTVPQPLGMFAERTQCQVQLGKVPVIAPKIGNAHPCLVHARGLRADPAPNDARAWELKCRESGLTPN